MLSGKQIRLYKPEKSEKKRTSSEDGPNHRPEGGKPKRKVFRNHDRRKDQKRVQLGVQSAGNCLENLREEKRKEKGNQGRGKVYVKSVYTFLRYREATVGRSGCRFRMASAQAHQVNREDQRKPEETG